jgi:tubulin polyglutamylase TTLL4
LLIDEGGGVSVLEVNISPAMSGADSMLDYEIKSRLMHDLLAMARIIDCDCGAKDPCPGIDLIDSQCASSVSRQRSVAVKSGKVRPWDSPVFADYQIARDLADEAGRLNGYRRLFPKRKSIDQFIPCYSQLGYYDVVQAEWIRLGRDERFYALEKNFAAYQETMAKLRAQCEPPSGSADEMR